MLAMRTCGEMFEIKSEAKLKDTESTYNREHVRLIVEIKVTIDATNACLEPITSIPSSGLFVLFTNEILATD